MRFNVLEKLDAGPVNERESHLELVPLDPTVEHPSLVHGVDIKILKVLLDTTFGVQEFQLNKALVYLHINSVDAQSLYSNLFDVILVKD